MACRRSSVRARLAPLDEKTRICGSFLVLMVVSDGLQFSSRPVWVPRLGTTLRQHRSDRLARSARPRLREPTRWFAEPRSSPRRRSGRLVLGGQPGLDLPAQEEAALAALAAGDDRSAGPVLDGGLG